MESKTKETIASILTKGMEKVLSGVAFGKNQTFSGIVKNTQEAMNMVGIRILEILISEIDRSFDKNRDFHRILVRNKSKSRRILTTMGEVTLHRQLYYDKIEKRYFFAVDESLGIPKSSRIDAGLQSQLIEQATRSSYGNASLFANNKVSRQTVHNLVKKYEPKKVEVYKDLKTVGNLFIEADEDHIHLNTGRNREVKLVYVHEGTKIINKGRTALINPHYFTSVEADPSNLWEEVSMYVFEHYKLKGNRIHISGDGAAWIKNGIHYFPGAIFHLDKFHTYKSITGACYGNKRLKAKIVESLKTRNLKQLTELYQANYHHRTKHSEQKTISEGYLYIKNNFDNIDLSHRYKCAAEGHISHVLSSRMSSRPMGWSVAGAERIAKLRAEMFNGADFSKLQRIPNKNTTTNRVSNRNFIVPTREDEDNEVQMRIVERNILTNDAAKTLKSFLYGYKQIR